MLISKIYGAGASKDIEKERYKKKRYKKKRRKLKALLRAGKISKVAYQARIKAAGKRKKAADLLDVPGTVRGYGEFRR